MNNNSSYSQLKNNLQNNSNINYYDDSDSDNEDDYLPVYFKDIFIYGWGKNSYGELGINSIENVFLPSPIKTFQNQVISQISSGGKHTLILTKDGKVYVSGSNMFGLLANNRSEFNNEQFQKEFKNMKFFTSNNIQIINISSAEFHSLAINKDYQIFAWGGNLHSKLGNNTGSIGQPVILQSLFKKRIVQISCGDYHSCAITDNGEIYSWGGGGSYNRGQCGQGKNKDIDIPKKIDFFKINNLKAKKVSCGGYHTIVLCENGLLFGFGKGDYGQCGFGESEDSNVPKLIKFNTKLYAKYEINLNDEKNEIPNLEDLENIENNFENDLNNIINIIDIKCGGDHSMFLSNTGRVYTCGHGYTGQLGLGNNKNINKPTIVMSLTNKTVKKIAAGWSHSLVLTDEGNVYVCGCGKYGELGLKLNDYSNRYKFCLVKNLCKMNVVDIFAGGHHSWCLVDNIYPIKNNFVKPLPLKKTNFNFNINNNSKISDNNVNKSKRKKSFQSNKSASSYKSDVKIEFEKNNVNQNEINEKYLQSKKLKELFPNESNFSNEKKMFELNNQNLNLFNLNSLNNNLKSMILGKIQLQLAYTDLSYSHRFIRFEISKINRNYNLSFDELNIKFQNYFNKDKGYILYRLQDDNEVLNNFDKNTSPVLELLFNEMKNFQIYSQFDENKKYFTLSMIYDYNKNSLISQIKENLLQNKNNQFSSFCFNIINEDDINNESSIENVLSNWTINFYNDFVDLFKDINNSVSNNDSLMDNFEINIPRFLELRPYYFNEN